jgi:hypothetical protein
MYPPVAIDYSEEILETLVEKSPGQFIFAATVVRFHQENMRAVFGHLWGVWRDLKTSKTQRPHIFQETGTFSFPETKTLKITLTFS